MERMPTAGPVTCDLNKKHHAIQNIPSTPHFQTLLLYTEVGGTVLHVVGTVGSGRGFHVRWKNKFIFLPPLPILR